MKWSSWLGITGAAALLTIGTTNTRGAEESFSRTVRAEDFSAAGLAKLSPEELARLDALVRDFKNGSSSFAKASDDTLAQAKAELAIVKREAETAEAARMAAEAKAAKAEAAANERTAQAAGPEKRKNEPGLLAKAKVLLTPGTEVEYADTDSRIAGNFTGWEGHTVFQLENGQRWQVANGGSYVTPPIPSPKVKIVSANFGGFWMTIEGVKQRVRVTPLGGGK